jgi:Arc/MetJ-type ribon-helix-helix transcriptional regulator
MTLTVRLPLRVEQTLAEYCETRRITKSDAVKEALDLLLASERSRSSAYELGKDLFGADDTPADEYLLYSKQTLRALVRSRRHRR